MRMRVEFALGVPLRILQRLFNSLAMTKGRARVSVLVLVGYRYRYSTAGTVLDLASTATVYSSYMSAAPAARMPRAVVAADGCTAVR